LAKGCITLICHAGELYTAHTTDTAPTVDEYLQSFEIHHNGLACSPLESSPSYSGPTLSNKGSLEPCESTSTTAYPLVQPCLHSSPMCPTHRHATCNLHPRIVCRQCGLKTFLLVKVGRSANVCLFAL